MRGYYHFPFVELRVPSSRVEASSGFECHGEPDITIFALLVILFLFRLWQRLQEFDQVSLILI